MSTNSNHHHNNQNQLSFVALLNLGSTKSDTLFFQIPSPFPFRLHNVQYIYDSELKAAEEKKIPNIDLHQIQIQYNTTQCTYIDITRKKYKSDHLTITSLYIYLIFRSIAQRSANTVRYRTQDRYFRPQTTYTALHCTT